MNFDPIICGSNPTCIDADLIGCGKPIWNVNELYRCTDCQVPFHRACAVKHFETDTPEHSAAVFETMIKRLDAKDEARKVNTVVLPAQQDSFQPGETKDLS